MNPLKVAYLLPKLTKVSSITLFQDLISQIKQLSPETEISVYYFDSEGELQFDCNTHKISFGDSKAAIFRDYDIIHSSGFRPDLFVFYHRLRFKKGTVFLSTIHSYILADFKNQFGLFKSYFSTSFWMLILSTMDSVVVLTEGAKRYYKHRLFSRIDVVNNGRGKLKEPDISIDDQQLLSKIRQRYKTVIGTHAKISKIKSIDTIIEALPSLSDTCLVVVGDGPQVESLKQLAKLKLIDDRVYFLGYRRDIGSYFKYYDIYAMPSISEGLPIALIEAVASRCVACLTSDIDTFNEVFDDSEVMKFRLKDYNHFAERVVELADDKELSFRFIENSYKKYLDKYTDEKMALNYLKLYSKLLDECKKRKNI